MTVGRRRLRGRSDFSLFLFSIRDSGFFFRIDEHKRPASFLFFPFLSFLFFATKQTQTLLLFTHVHRSRDSRALVLEEEEA